MAAFLVFSCNKNYKQKQGKTFIVHFTPECHWEIKGFKDFFFFFSYFGFVGSVKFLEACYMMSLVSFMHDAIHFIEKEIWQP